MVGTVEKRSAPPATDWPSSSAKMAPGWFLSPLDDVALIECLSVLQCVCLSRHASHYSDLSDASGAIWKSAQILFFPPNAMIFAFLSDLHEALILFSVNRKLKSE